MNKSEPGFPRLTISRENDVMVIGLGQDRVLGAVLLAVGAGCYAALLVPGLELFGPPSRNWADVKASWPLVLGAGLFLYGGLAGLVNQTRLTLNAERVRLAHAPLPFPGGVDLPRSQVETFRVIESGGTRVNNSTTRKSWTVAALRGRAAPEPALPDRWRPGTR